MKDFMSYAFSGKVPNVLSKMKNHLWTRGSFIKESDRLQKTPHPASCPNSKLDLTSFTAPRRVLHLANKALKKTIPLYF